MLNLPLAFLQCSSLKADVFVKLKIDNRIHPASVQVQLYCCNIFTNGRLHYISSLCDWKHNSVSMFPSRHVRWNVVSRWHGSMSTSAHLWPRLTTLGDAVSWVSSRVMMSGWWKSSGSRVSPKPCLNLSNSRHLCVWALCIFVTGRGQKGGDTTGRKTVCCTRQSWNEKLQPFDRKAMFSCAFAKQPYIPMSYLWH